MANMTATGTSDYPASLDTRTDLTDGSGGDEILSRHPDGLGAAIINIETELGVDPAGSATDVVTRLGVAHNAAGAVTLGTAASTVGLLAINRGGLGQTIASATVANGNFVGFANGVLQPLTITGASGVTAAATSGTWTISLTSTAKISGDWVQARRVAVTGFTTTNGTKAVDNNPITSSNGSGFGLTVDLLPTSTANNVYVWASLIGCNDTTLFSPVGLFLAGSSSAVMGSILNSGAAANIGTGGFLWRATTVSTATTTYALRIAGSAGTFTLNGQSGAGVFNNSATSELLVFEVAN